MIGCPGNVLNPFPEKEPTEWNHTGPVDILHPTGRRRVLEGPGVTRGGTVGGGSLGVGVVVIVWGRWV